MEKCFCMDFRIIRVIWQQKTEMKIINTDIEIRAIFLDYFDHMSY